MKSWERKLVPAGFALGGLLFLFAAVKPAIINGLPLNVAFLVISIFNLVLGVVLWRKVERGGGPPSV